MVWKSYYSNWDYGNQEPKFEIPQNKLYIAFVTLSTHDNEKLLRQLKTGFKRTINWNKYQSEPKLQTWNQNLNHLKDPSVQGVNRLFVSSFENDAHWSSYKWYFLPTVEITDYKVMIDEKNFFDQPVKNDLIIYKNNQKIATGQGDGYTTGCLLHCDCFKNYYKIIAIYLIKQQVRAW